MLTIGLQGATGRTGRLVLDVLNEFPDVALTHLTKPTADGTKIYEASETIAESVTLPPAIWIDFSTPEATAALVKSVLDSRASSGIVVATTGHSVEQLEALRRASAKIPILIAPNTSLGVFALKELTTLASSLLDTDDWEIHIEEAHHRFKKDAPSGTAKLLQDAALRGRPDWDGQVPTTSIRGGDIVGEHTVFLISNGERIELIHRATDRRIFARGAVKLAKVLAQQPAGLYGLTPEFFKGEM